MNLFKTAARVVATRSSEGLAQEHARAKEKIARKIRKLAESKRRYIHDVSFTLEKQKQELELLEREHDSYMDEMAVIKKVERKDEKDIEQLEETMAKVDDLEKKKKEAATELSELKRQIKQIDQELDKFQKIRSNISIANKRAVETKKYDNSMKELQQLREEIHNLEFTRAQLKDTANDLEADIKRLTYSMHKEIRYAGDNLEGAMNTRHNQKILTAALSKHSESFNLDIGKLQRTASQEKRERLFVELKNRSLHDISEERRRKKLLEQAEANKKILLHYSDVINDLREAFKDVLENEELMDEERRRAESRREESTRKGKMLMIKVESVETDDEEMEDWRQGRQAETGERIEDAEITEQQDDSDGDPSGLRDKTAAQVLREKLGEYGLEVCLKKGKVLLLYYRYHYYRYYYYRYYYYYYRYHYYRYYYYRYHYYRYYYYRYYYYRYYYYRRLYWQVYYTSQFSCHLNVEKADVRSQISDIHSRRARAAKLDRLKHEQLAASVQARKDMGDKTEEELERCNGIIQSYATSVRELMLKMGISEERIQQLTAPYDTINERNILRCLGAVERVVDDLNYQQTLQEFADFMPALQQAKEEGVSAENLPVPEPRPNRMELVERVVIVPPMLPGEEEDEADDDYGGLLEESRDSILSVIPLPNDWEERPLSKTELTEHIACHIDEKLMMRSLDVEESEDDPAMF
nr:hypothetical protein BaRGS_029538 [Batillaria attramentaria]